MTTSERATGALAVAAATALVVALASPVATAVIGLIIFGTLAVLLELRYLIGRLPVIARRDVVSGLAVLLAGTSVLRLAEHLLGSQARRAEAMLGFCVVALVARVGLRGRRRVVAYVVAGLLGAASLVWPDHYAFALLHLHQLVVLVFLWDWAGRLPRAFDRRLFRGVQLAWGLLVPAALLAGAVDSWLTGEPGIVRSVVGDGRSLVAAAALPGDASGVLDLRLLTVYAFLQTMQLLVWVAFMPRFATEESAAFEGRFPWLTGARVWAVGFIAAAVVAVVFAMGFRQGQVLFGALWSWAVHLEMAAALVVVAAGRRTRTKPRLTLVPDPPASAEPPTPRQAGPAAGGHGSVADPQPATAVAPEAEVGS
ncbi:hypothetical protein [Intrasporangium flavum]|uniref:hypothetical protein n=1 Tax=Intrasporangium flavum TaxID=1428657 RepID=UPI00096C9B71|nr:hypothetical protein [Intrasporangium flavum]